MADWLGWAVPLVWSLLTSAVRVVSDILLGVVLVMVWGVVDVCRGLVSLIPASTEDVKEAECIAFGRCMCPGTKFGSCIAVVLFVDISPTGVRATRLGGTRAFGLFLSRLFGAGMSGTRLDVI